MKITTFRREEITVQDLVAVRCDLCGITTNDNPSWTPASQNHSENECLIALRQGTRESGLAAESPAGLHTLLGRVDPVAAARIHPNDRYCAARALEVYLLGGEPLAERQRRHRAAALPAAALTFALALPPAELQERLRARIAAMEAAGLLEEARRLLAEGWDTALPAFRAVGYPQLFAHLRGEATLAAALAEPARQTWQYARRELTWLRALPGVRWIEAGGRSPGSVAAEILEGIAAAEKDP